MSQNNNPPILPLHERPYRLGMGIVVFNNEGKVFVGERSDLPGQWQLPQGGITMEEIETDIVAAGLRELEEETSIKNVELIAIMKDWVHYDFPTEGHVPNHSHKYRGQRQKYIAVRFKGEDSDINLQNHEEIEFQNFRWVDFKDVPSLIVGFKRPVYEAVYTSFKHIAEGKTPDLSRVQALKPRAPQL